MGKEHFFFFQAAETGNRTPNSGVKGSGANHYPRAPGLCNYEADGPLRHPPDVKPDGDHNFTQLQVGENVFFYCSALGIDEGQSPIIVSKLLVN